MIAKIYSAIPQGYSGHIIEVEGSTSNNLPTFNIVGMANKTISEARERVRTAIMSSNLTFPAKKVTINLAPAELVKDGSHLDLPIALAVLTLAKQLLPSDLDGKLFVGELSLDGFIRPVRGIINIVEAAKKAGFDQVFLPVDNLDQASLVPGITLIGVKHLTELLLHLRRIKTIRNVVKITHPEETNASTIGPFLDDFKGQPFAKRALTIALAGHHNLLLSGPPGTGKSFLAQIAHNLLPPPTNSEQIEITKLYSLSDSSGKIHSQRPFRAPHHTASDIAIIGGGNCATPGEISLAHHGILFLDEIPEFSRSVLEALRQPLEDHQISIAKAHHRLIYPANFILIATMNPCPCGFLGDPYKICTCTNSQIQNYQKKISGPILDRIDLTINLKRTVPNVLLSSRNNHTEHDVVKNTITDCNERQFQRYGSIGAYNGTVPTPIIQQYLRLSPKTKTFFSSAIKTLDLSARAYFKVLRIARTIADLSQSPEIDISHLSEALSYRQKVI